MRRDPDTWTANRSCAASQSAAQYAHRNREQQVPDLFGKNRFSRQNYPEKVTALLARKSGGPRFERLAANNEVAGLKFATLGVLYDVLLGFAVIVVFKTFHDAANAVAREAGAAALIYRLTHSIREAPGVAARSRLSAYLKAAVTEHWPAMERGRSSPNVTRALDSLYAALASLHSGDAWEVAIQTDLLHRVYLLAQARLDSKQSRPYIDSSTASHTRAHPPRGPA